MTTANLDNPIGRLKCLKAISGLGVFNKFSDGPEFVRYQTIYGWNASGKTTLARLFAFLEVGELHEDHNDTEFTVEYHSQNRVGEITEKTLLPHVLNIRVFNGDYIEKNISLKSKGNKAKPILRFGKESQRDLEQIDGLEKYTRRIVSLISKFEKNKTENEKNIGNLNTEVSKLIRSSAGLTQSYSKKAIESDFDNWIINPLAKKSDAEIEAAALIAKSQEEKNFVQEKLYNFFTPSKLMETSKFFGEVVLSGEAIEELVNNTDLAGWIFSGLKFHSEGGIDCKFCGSDFTKEHLNKLKLHFNKSFEDFSDRIDIHIESIIICLKNIEMLQWDYNQAAFYIEEHQDYEVYRNRFDSLKTREIAALKLLIKVSEFKKSTSHIKGDLDSHLKDEIKKRDIEFIESELKVFNEGLQKLLSNHNTRAKNFDSVKLEAKNLIRDHYLQSNIEYFLSLKKRLKCCDAIKQKLLYKKVEVTKKISDLKLKISSIQPAADDINLHLESFFGHNRIKIVCEKEDGFDCYRVYRNGKIANRLSEGETNAIALVYFIESLTGRGSKINDTIVILDDPICSYDSMNLFTATNFIRTHLIEAKQLIILTHSYPAFVEIRHWFHLIKTHDKENKVGGLKHFQLKRIGENESILTDIDPVLSNFHSEYDYLFSQVIKFNDLATAGSVISFEDGYNILNMLRKILETFLQFKYGSKNSKQYESLAKMRDLRKANKIDNMQALCIERLLPLGSHLNEDGLGDQSFKLLEHIPQAVSGVLAIIRALDPDHSEAMLKQTNQAA